MVTSRRPRTAADLVAEARTRYRRLTAQEARAAADKGAVLVDTRCADALRDEGTIPGALHIPLSVLPWRADPASEARDERLADPSRQVILMCAHGFSSSLAVASLLDLGFTRATDVEGGIQAWRDAGLPVVIPEV